MESHHSILQTAQEKVLKGMSESMGQDGRDVLAKEISKLKEEILQFANAQYGGKYLFSGTNNSAAPFTVNEDTGKLMYNGIEVKRSRRKTGNTSTWMRTTRRSPFRRMIPSMRILAWATGMTAI